jgi:hypothetical protein
MRFLLGFFVCLSIVILFVIAHIFCGGEWIKTFIIKREIDFYDVLSLIITSAVTIGTGWYIGKKVTEKRYEKDYFISDLKTIEVSINNIMHITSSNQSMFDLVSKLNTDIELFSNTIRVFDKTIDISLMNSLFTQIYTVTTNVDGIVVPFDSPIKIEIRELCSNFALEIRSLICIINKN